MDGGGIIKNVRAEMNHPKRGRKSYRLNKKKLAGMLLAIGCAVITIAVAAKLYEEAAAEAKAKGEDMGAVVIGSGIPEKTEALSPDEPSKEPADVKSDDPGELLIVVDAGHGGFDPGAIGANGSHEADINLEIAKRLKTELENRGAKVLMTREDDVGLGNTQQESLKERRRIIQQSGADMVISIHMNSFDDPDVSGPLVLFKPGYTEGNELADIVQQSLNEELGADGTARSDNLVVLESIDKPSILVECGFITSPKEEKDLKKPEYQDRIVGAICDGVDAFLSGDGDAEK
jgi:N-acetylmuramoyl-L-alanine amidase